MAAPPRESSAEASEWAGISESGDDDMDFELASSAFASQDDEAEEDDGGETTLYFDAEEGTFVNEDGEEIRVDVEEEEEEEIEEDDDGEDTAGEEGAADEEPPATGLNIGGHTIAITQEQLRRLLGTAGIRNILSMGTLSGGGPRTRSQGHRQHVLLGEDEEEEDDDDDGDFVPFGRSVRRRHRSFTGDRYPKVPSEEGKKLMASGTFGVNDRCNHSACGQPFAQSTYNKRRRLARRMFDRELGVENRGRTRALNSLATQDLIPGSKADMIINLNDRCYSGQFSEDGSFFFACGQDFKVRMYDTSNPYDWRYYKTVNYYGGQWTITDATLSPDNKHLAYSSIRSDVCLATTDPSDASEPRHLDFSNMGNGPSSRFNHAQSGHFGIWSLRFSGDGGEIVAGTSDFSVYVYDLEAQRSVMQIRGHSDDVNAVCFGDKMSPHILYSGSDDTTLKVWDRRSLRSERPAGMFLGHTEGLTYIDSKGDGRYVISNAKDQTCKLWDLRKMVSTDVGERINPQDYTTNFDYRFSPYDVLDHTPHPHDCSLVTFRGHRVLKTLIRCHFSPPTSTDQRYIYSGSHDGKVHIWNLDGTPRAQIDVQSATKNSRPASDERFADRYDYYGRTGTWKTIVRDASWHPSAPVVAATSWNGWDHGLGTTTVHSWNDGLDGPDEVGDDDSGAGGKSSLGSTPMGARVTGQLRHDARYYAEPEEPVRRRSGRFGAAIWGNE